jgi:enoyl-CoA hydratase
MDDVLLVDVSDRIATVTLNRPQQRNALTSKLIARLAETMVEVDDRPDVDVIVLTGADPAFCAGLDLRELGDTGENLGDVPEQGWATPWPAIDKPVIAAVNGAAVTGGLELVLHADLRVASDAARFADTHARVGVVPAWGMSVLLAEAVGVQRARWMSLTGAFVGAADAAAYGLVLEVVPHAALMPRVRQIAADIVAVDQAAALTILGTLRGAVGAVHEPGLLLEAEASARFRRERFDPAVVAGRREAVQQHGSEQVG